jgi:hypothetical protein
VKQKRQPLIQPLKKYQVRKKGGFNTTLDELSGGIKNSSRVVLKALFSIISENSSRVVLKTVFSITPVNSSRIVL